MFKLFISVIISSVLLLICSGCGDDPTGYSTWPDGADFYVGSSSTSDTSLAWSPTGYILLFSTLGYTSPCLYGYDGLNAPDIITTTDMNEFVGPTGCWNSAQGRILYTAIADDSLYEIRAVKGNYFGDIKCLLQDTIPHIYPSWNPDGDSIVFCRETDGYWGLWKAEYNEDSLECISLYQPNADCLRPSYSPDGEWILFQRSGDGTQSDIWIIKPDGTGSQAVVTGNSDDIHPCWGQENDRFAFSSDRSGEWNIWIGSIDGDSMFQVTDDPAIDIYPAWNPEYGWLVFSSDRVGGANNYDIFVIDL